MKSTYIIVLLEILIKVSDKIVLVRNLFIDA